MGRKGAQSSFVASVTALRTVVSCLTDMDIREPDIRSCGDNMVNVFDTDEEHFAVSSSSAADTAFDGVIGCIEDIIMEDDFQQLQQIFMEKHYREFDDSDENKLSYTPIFNEYIDLLEKYLEQQLMERIPGFNMDTFKELLMQHKEEVSGDIFDMLLTFTDFMAFKEMFLQYRAEKEGQCPDLSQGLVVTSLNLGGSKHADFNESQGISGRTSLFPFAMKV